MTPSPDLVSRGVRLALALVGLLVAAVATAGDEGALRTAAPEPAAMARLARGEVVLLAVAGAPARSAGAAVLIHAPPTQVWEVMIDCARAPEFVPNLRACRVLAQGEGTRLVEHRVKPSNLLPELTYRFAERWDEQRRIAFERVGGDLTAMRGSWELEPAGDDTTLVRYAVSLDPGFPVPRWAVRRALHHDLPLLLAALRARVEAAAGAGLTRPKS
jgi:ribosome-associated toxin RatA of RatAB toxin-antitoxin module